MMETASPSLEQMLEELEAGILKVKDHLRNSLFLMFVSELKRDVCKRLEEKKREEKDYSTRWTVDAIRTVADKIWEHLNRDKILSRWNVALPKTHPDGVSWWCLRVVVWKWTETTAFRKRVITHVTEQLLCE